MMNRQFAALLIPASMVIANAANLAVQVIVPHFLAPSEYSVLTLSWVAGQCVAIVAFEWLRLAIIRYGYTGEDGAKAGRRRNAIIVAYRWLFIAFVVLSGTLLLFGLSNPLMLSVALVALYALAKGVFDGNQAASRAKFEHGAYASSWVLSGILSVMLATIGGYVFGNANAVLIGLMLSLVTPVMLFRLASADAARLGGRSADPVEFEFIAKNGLSFALASIIGSAFPLLLRWLLVQNTGSSDGGGVLLALDLSQKVFLSVGTAINLLSFQSILRSADRASGMERPYIVSRQITVAALVLFPVILGFYFIQDFVSFVIVPVDYRVEYLPAIAAACAISGLFAVKLYCLDPLFLLLGERRNSSAGSMITICTMGILLLMARTVTAIDAHVVLACALMAVAVGLLATCFFVGTTNKCVWPWSDLAKICVCCSAIPSIAMACRALTLSPQVTSGILLLAGSFLYCTGLLILNVAGIRSWLGEISVLNRLRGR